MICCNRMRKIKIGRFSLFFWLFITWMICFSFLCSQREIESKTIFLLSSSLCYLIGFSFLKKIENRYKDFHGPAYYLFFIVCLMKYFVMPLSLCLSQGFSTIGPSVTDISFNKAVLLTVYEMVYIICLRFLFLRYYISAKKKRISSNEIRSDGIRGAFIFIFILLLGGILSSIPNFNIIPKNIFILDEGFVEQGQVVSYGVIITWWKYIFFISTFSLLYYLYQKCSNRLFYYLSVLLIFFFLGLITGTSRWAILFFLLISLYLSFKMYGPRIKKIILPISLISLAVIISITIYKFSWAFQYSENIYIDFFQVMIGQLQSYFSGPNLMAQALDMGDSPMYIHKITFTTFINDFLGSIPLVAGHVDQTDRINYYFNRYLFDWYSDKTSQIIPMTAVGAIYFNILLSPVFTILFTWLGFVFEFRGLSDKRIYCNFLYLYISFWCVLSICFCPQIIWGNLITIIFPIFIVYKLFVAKYR